MKLQWLDDFGKMLDEIPPEHLPPFIAYLQDTQEWLDLMRDQIDQIIKRQTKRSPLPANGGKGAETP